MSSSILIPARESPGGPPPGVDGTMAKLWWAARNPPQDPQVSFAAKTVLVTGANTGLGFEAAVKYARLGAAKLILAVRSVEKGEAAKRDIIRRTGRSSDAIVILIVDLSDFASVQSFIHALQRETSHLDAALLNAGLANPRFVRSAAGWEMALQVNVLSTALMAAMLLPILRTTASTRQTPHLSFVNSIAHADVKPDWYGASLLQAANDEPAFNAEKSYGMVKLLGMAVMQAIARQAPGVIVNACCPYMCKTDLGRNWGMMAKIPMIGFQAIFARTAEEGARTLVSATALGPESHGRFWHHDILFPVGDLAKDEDLMRKCWSDVFQAISVVQPDIQAYLDGRG